VIRLIGIDVDGTLVGESGVVAERVWAAAERARARGIRLALCSGRPAFGIAASYARRLDSDGWHVFQNGACVVDLESERSRSAAIAPEIVHEQIARARATHELLELYSDRDWVVEISPPWSHQHAKLLGVPLFVRPFESLTEPVVRAQWLLSPEAAAPVLAAPHPELDMAQSTSPLMPNTWFIGLTKRGVNKGSAIRAICEEYGVALSDVMYVGDAGNDLPALSIVGHPVAMADAADAVKQLAVRHVGRAEDGAVADAIEFALSTWS